MQRKRLLLLLAVATSLCGALLFFWLRQPRGNLRAPLTLSDYRRHLMSLALPPEKDLPNIDPALAAFGKKIFLDPRFSKNGQISCAFCHRPEQTFTDQKARAVALGELERNTPTIVNSVLNFWFTWDGRADSLAAQAPGPLEHPMEQGISRTRVIRLAFQNYRKDFEKSFGAWNLPALQRLPDEALPEPIAQDLPASNAAYAITTIAGFSQLASIMRESSQDNRSPARQFSHQVMQQTAHDPSWYRNWTMMSEDDRSYVNQSFFKLTTALAAYEETLYSEPSAFDLFAERVSSNAETALEANLGEGFGLDELEGFKIFVGKGQCILCHNGPNFTNNQFHNTGLGPNGRALDVGRARGVMLVRADPFNCQNTDTARSAALESCAELPFLDEENVELVGAFKTPTLRHVAKTAPYFHDGRKATLREVIDFYNDLSDQPAIGHREESMRPLGLTEEEKISLQAFLESLSSEVYERQYPAGTKG